MIDPDNERTFGPCSCCGKMTRRVWGYVSQGEATLAAYFVEWTPGHKDHAANSDFVVGRWGQGTEAADRKAVAIAFRHEPTGPAFMVVDAAERQVGTSPLVCEALRREQVIGTSIATTVFALCDSVFTQDGRISELRHPAS